jgi:hypothetical protein
MKKPILLALAALTLSSCGGGFTKTLTFTRDEIQSKVEEKFPIKRTATVVTLVLNDPNIVLEDGSDQIGLKANVNGKLPGSGLGGLLGIGDDDHKGSIYVEGGIEYEPVEGTFYFTKGKIRELSIEGFPEQIQDPISKLADLAVKDNLSKVPLFTLDTKDMKEKAAKFFLKKARVKNGKLEVIVGL